MAEPASSSEGSQLGRLLSSTGVYALAAMAQRGLAFVLLPIYTRYLDKAEYGVLELLTAFSSIVFGILALGIPSAITKCYHRDCESDEERRSILATAAAIGVPVALFGAGLVFSQSRWIAELLLGDGERGLLIQLVAATGVLTSMVGLLLASLRAEERAIAYSVVTLAQFTSAVVLNIVLVVGFERGVEGVLWGNLTSNALVLPLALLLVRRRARLQVTGRLLRPMLNFGVFLVPVFISSWIIDLSDRYILRYFHDLEQVASYGVGYKVGMVLQLLIVWPFQLAWPAFSFAISNEPGHRQTYARVLTYLVATMVYVILALSLTTRVGLVVVAGDAYADAYRFVPLAALAYAFNGIRYCVVPGVHLSNKTRYLSVFSLLGAALNLVLNWLLIPQYAGIGAAIATALSLAFIAACTALVAQTNYRVRYEYGRLAVAILLGAAIFWLAGLQQPRLDALSILWYGFWGLAAMPLVLLLSPFLRADERTALVRMVRTSRLTPGR